MDARRFQFLVLTKPVDGADDAEFNRWYTERHLKDVLDCLGFLGAKRFKIISTGSGHPGVPAWQYAAIYEMETDRPDAVLEELYRRAGTEKMPISQTLDMSSTATFLITEIAAT